MSSSIETELRAALEHASEALQPCPDLVDRVRRANRHRRHVLTGAITAGLIAVTVGGLIAVHVVNAGKHHPATRHHAQPPPAWQVLSQYGTPVIMAATGRRLYVAVDDPGDSSLIAYDLTTGKLIRRIGIPAQPSGLRIGPGGLVWLSFYPDNFGGGTGVWLLSPDLTMRSSVSPRTPRHIGAAPFDVLPTGAETAVLATDQGLARLRLPLPGQPGAARLRWGPLLTARDWRVGLPVQVAAFAGRVAVRLASDTGFSLITLAGPRQPVFFPNSAYSAGSMAVTGRDLWITIFDRNGDASRGLIRLDDRLSPTTPTAISRNQLLARAQQAAAIGSTVWVILPGRPGMACFTDRGGQIGPVATIATHAPQAVSPTWPGGSLAVADGTIYVLTSVGVDSYRVPAACR